MSHLGRWLSALVDGELDAAERDHVLNHLAGCSPCLREANEMRALKRRLTALGESADDSAIAGRLIELVRSEQGAFGPPAGPDAHRTGEPAAAPEPGRRLVPASLVRQGWTIAAGSATAGLAVIGVVAFVLGTSAGPPPAPKVTPSVDSYVLQHAYDAGQARVRPGSPISLLHLDQGSADQGVAGYGPSGAGSYGRWRTSSGTLVSPAPVAPVAASPSAATSAAPAAPVGHPGHHSARYKAP